MIKNITFVKIIVFFVLFAGLVSSPALSAQSSQAASGGKSAFHGTWEIQTNKGVYIISFVDDIFTIFNSAGGYVLGGVYHIGVTSPWNIRSNTRNPQYTRNLFLMIDLGLGLDELGFTYEISSNSLILSSVDINNDLRWPLQIADTNAINILSGTYRKISFTEPVNSNMLIGLWKVEFPDGNVEFLRFFSNNQGSFYGYRPDVQYVVPFTYNYESGSGRYTLLTNGRTGSFTVRGNVLMIEGDSAGFVKVSSGSQPASGTQNNQVPQIFRFFDLPDIEGVLDLGFMSRTAANRRMNEEYDAFLNRARASNRRYTDGVYYDGINFTAGNDFILDCIDFISEYFNIQNGRVYKGWYMNTRFEPFVFYIWFGNNNEISYLMYSIVEL